MIIVIKKTFKLGRSQVPRNQLKPRCNFKKKKKKKNRRLIYTTTPPALVIDHRISLVSKAELNENHFLFPNISKIKALKFKKRLIKIKS